MLRKSIKKAISFFLLFIFLFMFACEDVIEKEKNSNAEIIKESCGENHNFKIVKKIDSTCKNEGYQIEICSECGYERKISLPISDHKYEIKEEYMASTCQTQGSAKFACKFCQEEKTELLPLKEHNYSVYGKWVRDKRYFNCMTDNFRETYCSMCGNKGNNDILKKIGHNWGNDGYCTICGLYKTVYEDFNASVKNNLIEIKLSQTDIGNGTDYLFYYYKLNHEPYYKEAWINNPSMFSKIYYIYELNDNFCIKYELLNNNKIIASTVLKHYDSFGPQPNPYRFNISQITADWNKYRITIYWEKGLYEPMTKTFDRQQ